MKIEKGPFKGMLRVDVQLDTQQSGDVDGVVTDGLVFKTTDQLAITPRPFGSPGKEWWITHRKSGKTVGAWGGWTGPGARKQLRTLLPLGKWDAIYKALYK